MRTVSIKATYLVDFPNEHPCLKYLEAMNEVSESEKIKMATEYFKNDFLCIRSVLKEAKVTVEYV